MSNWISSHARLFAWHFDLRYPGPGSGELDFLLRRVAEGGEPVLELGCGTGRMLAPLLERGLEVCGVDVSNDLLERCRRRAADARLEVQAMEELELGRRFGTVFLGSGGLGVLDREEAVKETFRRVFAHLEIGGVFSCEFETPPARVRTGVWSGGWDEAEDGSLILRRVVHEYDEATHVRSSVMVFERWVEGRLEESELHRTTMRFWEAATLTRWLDEAGFVGVVASKVFTDDEPPGDHAWLVVRGRKR